MTNCKCGFAGFCSGCGWFQASCVIVLVKKYHINQGFGNKQVPVSLITLMKTQEIIYQNFLIEVLKKPRIDDTNENVETFLSDFRSFLS